MKYIVTLNGTDYEVEVDELKEAIVTNVAPASAPVVAEPVAPAAAPVSAPRPRPPAPPRRSRRIRKRHPRQISDARHNSERECFRRENSCRRRCAVYFGSYENGKRDRSARGRHSQQDCHGKRQFCCNRRSSRLYRLRGLE